MKIVIAGGSGHIGTALCRHFTQQGHEVVVLSRNPAPALWQTRAWDGRTLGPWRAEVEAAGVVINLAGRSIDCRFTAAHRRELVASRIESTRAIGEAIATAAHPPRLWLQASTAAVYAHRFDAPNDDATGIIATPNDPVPETWRFTAQLVQDWERAALEAPTPRTRRVLLRTTLVMSPAAGSVFDVFVQLARRGLGGANGNGRQYVSWIHETDFIAALDWLVAHEDMEGPVNLASPHPLPNAEFMRDLRRVCGVPIGVPSPAWMLEIAMFFRRSETELVLRSRRVVPGRLLDSGFVFQFPDWPAAAADLYRRWQTQRR